MSSQPWDMADAPECDPAAWPPIRLGVWLENLWAGEEGRPQRRANEARRDSAALTLSRSLSAGAGRR